MFSAKIFKKQNKEKKKSLGHAFCKNWLVEWLLFSNHKYSICCGTGFCEPCIPCVSGVFQDDDPKHWLCNQFGSMLRVIVHFKDTLVPSIPGLCLEMLLQYVPILFFLYDAIYLPLPQQNTHTTGCHHHHTASTVWMIFSGRFSVFPLTVVILINFKHFNFRENVF